jgi:hypothetical protein
MALGLLSLISIAMPAPAEDATAEAWSIVEWEAAWTKVLTRYVDDAGRIDFDSLRRNHSDWIGLLRLSPLSVPTRSRNGFLTSTRASPFTSMPITPWQCTESFRRVFPKVSAA